MAPDLLAPLAIIAGTGFSAPTALTDAAPETVATPYGPVVLTRGQWHGIPVIFVPRHGVGHDVPPHLVNYRANIRALADAGCADVLAINVAGGIDPALPPGSLVCLDDFLDFTHNRVGTFHDGSGPEGVVHVDVSRAYDRELRRQLLAAAGAAGQPMRDGGVYACFEGPRFESPAEVRMAGHLGGHVVGMTGVPEVTLAVEAGLRYAAVSLVVNPAAGLGDGPITMEEVAKVLAASSSALVTVLDRFVLTRAGGP